MDGITSTQRCEGKGTSWNSVKRSETRKASVAFGTALNEKEVEEKTSKNSGPKSGINVGRVREKKCKTERPTSAGLVGNNGSFETGAKQRPKSSGALHGGTTTEKLRSGSGERKRQIDGRKEVENRDCCCWQRPTCAALSESESLSAFSASVEDLREPWPYFRYSCHAQRKCYSSCNFSKALQNSEKNSSSERDFHKMKRSLRLLGFEPSEFGINSDEAEITPKRPPKQKSPTFSTRVIGRSVSLDSLRVAVRRAWLDDRLDESHRRLLAQAAYEEWYFTKERELREKREEDRVKRLNLRLKLRDDFQRKKAKSEEEFQKWLSRKTAKRKGQEEPSLKKQGQSFNRLIQTKEKSEKAFLNWKKSKDKEMERKKVEKRKEEEKKMESEKEKAERKKIAEKAFQQWMMKLEENERKKDKKGQMEKKKQEVEERKRRKRAEGSQISFQIWKEAKDGQIKEKVKQWREAERTAREERFAQMEERMYEAEQAFEDWLERVDIRKQQQFCGINAYQKTIPWIPV